MFSSYRHQPVDLQSKSTDWFPYDGNIGRLRVNGTEQRNQAKMDVNFSCCGQSTITGKKTGY